MYFIILFKFLTTQCFVYILLVSYRAAIRNAHCMTQLCGMAFVFLIGLKNQ